MNGVITYKDILAARECMEREDLLVIDAPDAATANTISFNAEGKIVGSLDLGADPIMFTGNADEAAVVFFDAFIRLYDQRYKELQEQVDKIAEFFPVCGEVQCTEQYQKIQAAIKGEEQKK